MLARYRMTRGARPADDPLPDGIRQDTRKHTKHCLRPSAELVQRALGDGSPAGWRAFARDYRALLDQRAADDPAPFDALAQQARDADVYLGCSCPTQKNPDVANCHTAHALRFMAERYPDLQVEHPG